MGVSGVQAGAEGEPLHPRGARGGNGPAPGAGARRGRAPPAAAVRWRERGAQCESRPVRRIICCWGPGACVRVPAPALGCPGDTQRPATASPGHLQSPGPFLQPSWAVPLFPAPVHLEPQGLQPPVSSECRTRCWCKHGLRASPQATSSPFPPGVSGQVSVSCWSRQRVKRGR